MKSTFAKSIVVLAATLVAGVSFAGDRAALTREQVRTEYLQAMAQGTLAPTAEGHVAMIKPSASKLTREAVQAEYFAARMAGSLPVLSEGQQATAPAVKSNLTREAVQADYIMALKAGTLRMTQEGA